MNIYAIYINPEQKNNNFVVIEESFSWTAAILSVFWALYYKMWLPVVIAIIINIFATTISHELALILKLIVMLIFGFFAADIRENYLKRNNYELKDIVVANSQIEAELRFLERNNYV